MTDAPHHHAGALKYEDWAGEMGARWLANLTGFESTIAPAGEALLAHPAPATDPAEWEVTVIGEKSSECQPECRTFCVTAIMIGDPLAQVLTATGILGRNAYIEEG